MSFVPSADQRRVIESSAGVTLVLGGAGCGKTTTATAAAAWHLKGSSEPPPAPKKRVLFLSFSRTAVDQIIDRSGSVLGASRSQVDVMTFHSLAWRIVRSFGRFYGVGVAPKIASAAELKMFPDVDAFKYDDLVPEAVRLLSVPTVSRHYMRRYGLVICDEFQDTNDVEWAFVRALARGARLLLLGDPNQCIYAGMKKISPEARIRGALAVEGALRVDLPTASYRDPSGIIPAAADEVRRREFNGPALRNAVLTGAFTLSRPHLDCLRDHIVDHVCTERLEGRSVNIYVHTQAAAAEVSSMLRQGSVPHEEVGFNEAFGEALAAQIGLIRYAVEGLPGGRAALACYAMAISRGKAEQEAARAIVTGSDPAVTERVTRSVSSLRNVWRGACRPQAFFQAIRDFYLAMEFCRGYETWARASRQLERAAASFEGSLGSDAFAALVASIREDALLGASTGSGRAVQVMNLHQTKGREADSCVLIILPNEYYGPEREPYVEGARLTYVSLTRARERVHVVAPGGGAIHRLWEPFVEACATVSGEVPSPPGGDMGPRC